MTHIKRLCQKPKKPNLTQAGEGGRLSPQYYCRSPTLTYNILCNVASLWNVSVWPFLNFHLFFKAREQIEKENENKSEDQQLDSSKQAMDEEDEDLLATIANKILESWCWNCMVCLIVNWKVFSWLCLIETDCLVVPIWKYWLLYDGLANSW